MFKRGHLLKINALSIYLYKLFTNVVESNGMTPVISSAEFNSFLIDDGLTDITLKRRLKLLLKESLNLYMNATKNKESK